ncbi:hypothetical protein HMPREF1327_02719 [Enterococcus faecalis 599]|uniref:Cfr-L n=4 Tax=Bacillales TaxID=1385 RepID=A5HBK8_STAAU|nr:Cfr-L [Staphylococcus aureus]ADN44268.1 Cfr-L [Bacillus sp. BS-02]AGB06239.1 hypothetical protein [Staphylococcus epidermidis]EJU86204.1 hypothetical protein HMPREF1327_02719 [Enterococcus faecalis 599]UBU60980.1 hypothetical protein [Enterococcus casseliflavus]CAC04524.1 unnamed protein product [Mammaliicoccus sciuri]
MDKFKTRSSTYLFYVVKYAYLYVLTFGTGNFYLCFFCVQKEIDS